MSVRLGISGYTIAGEAANGETAYQQILALQPDIVLKTSACRGMLRVLTLSWEARAQGFTGKVIILSGYSDFQICAGSHPLRSAVLSDKADRRG